MQLMLPELISIMVVSFAVMEVHSKVLYQISVCIVVPVVCSLKNNWRTVGLLCCFAVWMEYITTGKELTRCQEFRIFYCG
jgi:hypothetical protein